MGIPMARDGKAVAQPLGGDAPLAIGGFGGHTARPVSSRRVVTFPAAA
jgi:hypothetical protein